MTTNNRDLENRFDERQGDGDEDGDELDEVEQWRAFIESATEGGDGERKGENVE